MFKKLCIILLLLSPLAASASYSISPTKLEISKKKKIGSLTFENQTSQEAVFQVTILKKDPLKKDTYIVNKDLMITPLVFKMLPNGKQLIRIATKNTTENGKYRVSIKELQPAKSGGNAVVFLTEIIIGMVITD